MTETHQANNAVDLLISAAIILPVRPTHTVLQQHSIAVSGGAIVDILPSDQALQRYQPARHIDLPDHLLCPGLINAHGHAAMSLFRGMADDQPLKVWLEQHIWPAEGQWVSEEFVADGTALAIAEMLRSGTTTFSDMYFFPDVVARTAMAAGIRAQITFPVFDFPSAWGQDADDYIRKGLALRDDVKHSERLAVVFGPHAPYTVSDAGLAKVAMLSAELDAAIQIHVHETPGEVDDALLQTGLRPLQRLNDLGILCPRTQLVHMTALNDADIHLVKQSGSHVVHCPRSNMKLASGLCPTQQLLNQGINVALGTDGAASNNSLDMFTEMASAALSGKIAADSAGAIDAWQTLEMATINGAKALGMEDQLGSLETGKQADIIAIDMSELEQQPLYQPASQLVYTPCGHRVSHSWIQGQMALKDRQPLHLDSSALIAKAKHWQQQISPR